MSKSKLTRRDFLKGIGAGVATFALAGEAGISVYAEDGTASTDAHITVALSSAVQTLSPWATQDIYCSTILNNVYQKLAVKVDGILTGVLMKDWSTEDGYTYNMEIYDNIYDSAGNPFTASDAVYSLLKCKEIGSVNNAKYFESAETVSDTAFTVTLTSNGLGILDDALPSINMVTQAAYEASSDEMATSPVGTGAYVVTEWVAGSTCTVERTDDFWWKDDYSLLPPFYVPRVASVTYDFITEVTQMNIALQDGTVDIGWKVNSSLINDLTAQENLSSSEKDSGFVYMINFNLYEGSPFCDNLALRQAVCYAIDEEGLCDVVTDGHGTVNYALQSPDKSLYNEEWYTWDYYQYDPEKASELLAEAGYAPGELTIKAICNNANTIYSTALELIQAYLSVIGIDMEIQAYDPSTFNVYRYATSSEEFDIIIQSMSVQDYAGATLSSQFDRSRFSNNCTSFGLSDDYLQEQLEILMTAEGNTQEQADIVETYIRDNMYGYSLFSQYSYCIYDNTSVEEPYIDDWLAATAVEYIGD